jgi:hypothetical protein
MEPEGPEVDQLQIVYLPIHQGSVDATQSIPPHELYEDLDSMASDPETPLRYTPEAESEQQEAPAPIDTFSSAKVLARK